MLFFVLIFLVALAVFIGIQIYGADKAGKVDRIEKRNPGRARAGAARAAGGGQTEGVDRDPTHGVSAMESNKHGVKKS